MKLIKPFQMVVLLALVISSVLAQRDENPTRGPQGKSMEALASPDTHRQQKNEQGAPAPIDSGLLPYLPQPVSPPKNARYVLRDGSIAIVGYNDMDGIFANLNALF